MAPASYIQQLVPIYPGGSGRQLLWRICLILKHGGAQLVLTQRQVRKFEPAPSLRNAGFLTAQLFAQKKQTASKQFQLFPAKSLIRKHRRHAGFIMKSAVTKKRPLAQRVQLSTLKSINRKHARRADFIIKSAVTKKTPVGDAR